MEQKKSRLKSKYLIGIALLTIALTGGGCLTGGGLSNFFGGRYTIQDQQLEDTTGLFNSEPSACEKQNESLTTAEIALANKKAVCDTIETRWLNHPDKSSAQANAIVTEHRACLNQLPKFQEDVNNTKTAWDDCIEAADTLTAE